MKRTNLGMRRGGWLVATCGIALWVQAEPPSVVWWSDPVRPGEAVEIFGGAWGRSPRLLCDGQEQPILKRTETGLWFECPPGAGIPECRVVSESGESKPFSLNAPTVWWLQADRGPDGTAGGWVRFFGRCLDNGHKAARARLVSGAGERFELSLTARDVWSLDAALPKDIPVGRYAAFIHNGAGGEAGWRPAGELGIVAAREVWKETRFDVTDFGAVPNDGRDDTAALQAALHAAETNGGGIVYLPRGRFCCTDTLVIPPYTLLRGADRDLTSLYWPDTDSPPDSLLKASHSFGIEELFIHSGHYRNGLTLDNKLGHQHELTSSRQMLSHDITLRRCIFKFIIDQYLLRDTLKTGERMLTRGNGLNIRDARFIRVEDCDIYCSKEGSSTLYFIVTGDYVKMSGCRINGSGWAVVGGDHVIYEKNDAWNCTYSISSVTRNLFWSKNRQHDLFTNNRESVTHDSAKTAFRDKRGAGFAVPGVCAGTKVTLDFDGPAVYVGGPAGWVGYELQIVTGRGAGQTRQIRAIHPDGREITIDRPFDLVPDETSRYVVASERRNLLYVDNDIEDSSIGIQLYGGVTDCVLARNRCRRTGGFIGSGRNYHGIIPCWCVQFLENEIESGNSYRGPQQECPPRDAALGAYDWYTPMALTRAYVIRRNTLRSNAYLVINSEDALVEGNLIEHTDLGIRSERFQTTVLFRGNRFEDVTRWYSERLLSANVFHPLEGSLARIGCIRGKGAALTALQKTWRQLMTKARNAPEVVKADAQSSVQILHAVLADGVPMTSALAAELFGLTVEPRPWDVAIRDLFLHTHAVSNFSIPLQVSCAVSNMAAVCELAGEPAEIGGWKLGKVSGAIAPGRMVTLALPVSVAAGERGPFSLPLRVTMTLADGTRFSFRTWPQLLTQNRIRHWRCARGGGEIPKDAWKPVTQYSPHGECDLGAEFPGLMPGESVTAETELEVRNPVVLNFEATGTGLTCTVNGQPLTMGAWRHLTWQPGRYRIRVVKKIQAGDTGRFKLFLRNFEEPVLPGDVVVCPVGG